jgi:hypothetical protein
MNKALLKFAGPIAVASAMSATPALGQASQTWVSGTGSGSACTRTQPCRTFAQAYAVTEAGGQIQVLSSGEFGPLYIKKSITIKAEGALGSIVANEYNGITIDVYGFERVVIDGLDIDGTPNGSVGIMVLGGGHVLIRNTAIRNFSSAGIYLNGLDSDTNGLTIDNVLILNAQKGIWVSQNGPGFNEVAVRNSTIIGGAGKLGISASGSNSRVRISGNMIRFAKSLDIQTGAVVESFGDNILSPGDAPIPIQKK